tara:strand:- start:1196 stop:2257 length:1062 start_codon:yes stop_codon:yes gene_type:complete
MIFNQNMIGGSENINNKYLEIIEKYNNIPDSGLFDQIETENDTTIALNKFKIFCSYILNITKNDKIYQLMQKKFMTTISLNKSQEISYIKNQVNLTQKVSMDTLSNTISKVINENKKNKLNIILEKVLNKHKYHQLEKQLILEQKKQGEYSFRVGHEFEKEVSKQIIPAIANSLKLPENKLKLIENGLLKIKRDNNEILIGEVDIIVLMDNQIIAIGEIKKSLDDISDALFQINRTFITIKNNQTTFLEFNNKKITNIFDKIKLLDEKELLKRSFIFTQYDTDKKYKKIPSKLSLFLLHVLWLGNIKNISNKFYRKIFFRLKKKQKKRYKSNVIFIFNKYNKENLIDRIQLSN